MDSEQTAVHEYEFEAQDRAVDRPRRRYLLLFAAFALGLLFFPFGGERESIVIGRFCDAGHAPLFAFVALAMFAAVSARRSFEYRLCYAAVGASAVAAAVELVQPLVGRSSSGIDLLNGLLGIIIALLGLVLWPFRRVLAVSAAYLFALLAAAVVSLLPTYKAFRAVQWQRDTFPVLATFENADEILLWRPADPEAKRAALFAIAKEFATDGERSLKVVTVPGTWSGVAEVLDHQDWRGKKRLRFSIYNPGDPFTIKVRIDDDGDVASYEDRFNTGLRVETGSNSFQLPLAFVRDGPKNRELNLEVVTKFYLFVPPAEPERVFWLDAVHLE